MSDLHFRHNGNCMREQAKPIAEQANEQHQSTNLQATNAASEQHIERVNDRQSGKKNGGISGWEGRNQGREQVSKKRGNAAWQVNLMAGAKEGK